MNKKSLITVSLVTLFLSGFARPAFADGVDFGSCLNPRVAASQVNVKNNHGVAGTTTTYAGTDKIYNLSNGNTLQCLCPDNGKGIQTNWLSTKNMSQADISQYKHDGWIYVVTGSTWGLADVPYLAKNSDYACKSVQPQTQSKVVTLASTGNVIAIYGLVIAGIFSLIAGLLLKKFSK
jgi:hypothetical protein